MDVVPSRDAWDKFLVSEETAVVGLYGGGSFRVSFVPRRVGGGGATDCESIRIVIRGTVTQSGSSLYVYGFDARSGFGIAPF